MTHGEIVELLLTKGFSDGWVLTNGVLTIWEHKTDPPAPLTRPVSGPEPDETE